MTDEVVVYDGRFWVNVEGILTKERRREVMKELENSDGLLLVDNCIWVRIDSPLPTKRQGRLLNSPWKNEDIEAQRKARQIPRLK